MTLHYEISQIVQAHGDSIRGIGVYRDKEGCTKLATVSRDSQAKIFAYKK